MNDLQRLLDQVSQGLDFPSPQGLLRGIDEEEARVQHERMPYSLLTNLAHAVRWQEFWLDKLRGERPSNAKVDREEWDPAQPGEYPNLRHRLAQGLVEAREIAARDDLSKTDQETIIRIALHCTYHLGQMNLLKQVS